MQLTAPDTDDATGPPTAPSAGQPGKGSRCAPDLFLALGLVMVCGCANLPRLPEADLTAPGWSVRQGQASWQPGRGKAEIAGELLVARREDGRTLVQFSKPPFPIVTAQTAVATDGTPTWEASFPAQARRYSRKGPPPRRLLWLYLPKAMSGEDLPEGVTWEEFNGEWRLSDRRNGASIRGYFD